MMNTQPYSEWRFHIDPKLLMLYYYYITKANKLLKSTKERHVEIICNRYIEIIERIGGKRDEGILYTRYIYLEFP